MDLVIDENPDLSCDARFSRRSSTCPNFVENRFKDVRMPPLGPSSYLEANIRLKHNTSQVVKYPDCFMTAL